MLRRETVWAAVIVCAGAGCAGADGKGGVPGELGMDEGTSTGPAEMGDGSADDGTSADPSGETSVGSGDESAGSGIGDDTAGETGVETSCGDGVVDVGEACDEPNGVNADGCNEDCTASGSVLWSQTGGGRLGLADDYFGVAVAQDERAYVTGVFGDDGVDSDLWVREYQPDGASGWDQVVDGTAHALDAGRGAVVVNGSLYVAGKLAMVDAGDDWRVEQYSLDGAQGWTANFGGLALGDDAARGVAADAAGNLYVAGRLFSANSDGDTLVRQYSADGVLGWATTHDGLSSSYDSARAVAVDDAGNVVVAGFETIEGHERDGWVGKFDVGGALLWARSVQGVAGLDDLASGVAVDDVGRVYAVGHETIEAGLRMGWVRRWNADGTDSWTHEWNGPAFDAVVSFLAVGVDSAGHTVAVGTQASDLERGLVHKLDGEGGVLWSHTLGDPVEGDKRLRAVAIGPGDHIWAAGRIDMGPGDDGVQGWLVRVAP